jgi:beta-N-acetylhexosaminidase
MSPVPELEDLDLEQRIGLCFMVGHGPEGLDPELGELLGRGAVGGVILFARNGSHASEMEAAIHAVREVASGWPLVALDQEGGPVLRVREEASDLPSAMALGAGGDPARTRAVGRAAGRELLALGADLNLAPVLDVNRLEANPGIGIRSFGVRSEQVCRHGPEFLTGMLEAGALGTGKHFPGKGASAIDAHLAMARVEASREELLREDLPPFRAVVEAGAAALMTSHVIYPGLDPETPGTLSPEVVRLAREELGFQGLLLSDDLEMGAMKEGGDPGEHAVRCLASGHDLLLVCHSRDVHAAMRDAVRAAVEAGELPAARVDEACARVLAAQRRAAAATRGDWRALVEEHRGLIDEAHAAAVAGWGPVEPLDRDEPWTVFVPELQGLVQVEEGTGTCEELVEELRAGGLEAEVVVYRPKDGAGLEPREGRAVLLASYNAHLLEAQATNLARVAGAASRVALLALRNPFDLRLLPDAGVRLASFGFGRGAQRAAGRVLVGAAEATGTLPWLEAVAQ